jgi:Flp pilus assembly protein TadG
MPNTTAALWSRALARVRDRQRGLDGPRPRAETLQPDRLRDDGGTAIVEFALVLPFLALVVFGTIDLGRVYNLQHQLTNMAREGAMFGQYKPGYVNGGATTVCASPANITARARNEDHALAADPKVSVVVSHRLANSTTYTTATGCSNVSVPPGSILKVEVRYSNFRLLTPLTHAFTGGETITLKGTAEVVVQGATA